MRTNIVIDDELMAKVLAATGLRTKREAGLRLLAQRARQAAGASLYGKLRWEGDLDAERGDDGDGAHRGDEPAAA